MRHATLKAAVMTAMGLVMAAPQAQAVGSLMFDLRSDFVNTHFNDAGLAAGGANNTSFQLNTARIQGFGEANERLSYFFRFDLTDALGPATQREGASSFVQYAYISTKLIDNLDLRVGKLTTGIGGFEGSVSTPDTYLRTRAYDRMDHLRYATGAALNYNMDNNNVTFMVVNPGSDRTNANGINQDRFAWGLRYSGQFMDGVLLPVASYFEEGGTHPGNTTAGSADEKNTYVNVGLKYAREMFDVEADYHMIDSKNTAAAPATAIESTTGWYALARYKMGGFKPFVKYGMSEDEATGGAKTEWTNMTAAVEYYPAEDQLFRYHLAYTMRTAEPDGGQKAEETNIIAGVRILADILK